MPSSGCCKDYDRKRCDHANRLHPKIIRHPKQKTAPPSETNDFFCWSANLITVKRRKAVVVVNDSNRFGFVLFGLKAKDFAQLDHLIADASGPV